MHLTYTAWGESHTLTAIGGGGAYRSPQQKRESVSLHDLSSGRHLLRVALTTNLKSNLLTALTTQNTHTKKLLSHTHRTRLHFRPSIFLTGINPLLVASKGRPAFRSADHCQGQLQTPQSLYVATSRRPQWVKFVVLNRAKAVLGIGD
jgi:hypothetical protein